MSDTDIDFLEAGHICPYCSNEVVAYLYDRITKTFIHGGRTPPSPEYGCAGECALIQGQLVKYPVAAATSSTTV